MVLRYKNICADNTKIRSFCINNYGTICHPNFFWPKSQYTNLEVQMKKTRFATLVLVVMMLLIFAVPAVAVTDGELDGEDHPHVVLDQSSIRG